MRVYLPATMRTVASFLTEGELGPAPLTCFAVTPGMREWYTEGDAEELEYAAMTLAAQASLRLLAADPASPRRRVVVAADVEDAHVTPLTHLDRAAVRVETPVARRQVASVHVDDAAAEDDVLRAAAAVLAADLGDDAAQLAVDDAQGHELAWFAVQELPGLLANTGVDLGVEGGAPGAPPPT